MWSFICWMTLPLSQSRKGVGIRNGPYWCHKTTVSLVGFALSAGCSSAFCPDILSKDRDQLVFHDTYLPVRGTVPAEPDQWEVTSNTEEVGSTASEGVNWAWEMSASRQEQELPSSVPLDKGLPPEGMGQIYGGSSHLKWSKLKNKFPHRCTLSPGV